MRYDPLRRASAALLLSTLLAGCVSTAIANDVPDCAALIPASLTAPVAGTDLPEPRVHADGHEEAQPWQEGFFGQSVQLEKANERPPAIDHIYRQCLANHRKALERSRRGFFGRLFGG
jgi:hypothetical protein